MGQGSSTDLVNIPSNKPTKTHKSEPVRLVSTSTVDDDSSSRDGPRFSLQDTEDLTLFPWHHGATTRNETEHLLNSGINGSFLIRLSESFEDQLCLSVRYEGKVYHYRINQTESGKYYIADERNFATIPDLVNHHSRYPDGLVTSLLYPANKRTSQEAHVEGDIDRLSIQMKDRLGGGQYGDVYCGFWKTEKRKVAVKTLRENTSGLQEFLREAQLMKKLSHSNLVELVGVCTDQTPYYIVTEYMPNGNLLQFLRSKTLEQLPVNILIAMAIQVASGMAYLETMRVVHRDLAARNCLVGDENLIKVADFGLARFVEDGGFFIAKSHTKFPIKWTSPEGLAFSRFSTKSDIWSFGVVLWELATFGKSPYPSVHLSDMLMLLEKGYRMECPKGCPSYIYQLMLKCWQWEAAKRPTFEQLHKMLNRIARNTAPSSRSLSSLPSSSKTGSHTRTRVPPSTAPPPKEPAPFTLQIANVDKINQFGTVPRNDRISKFLQSLDNASWDGASAAASASSEAGSNPRSRSNSNSNAQPRTQPQLLIPVTHHDRPVSIVKPQPKVDRSVSAASSGLKKIDLHLPARSPSSPSSVQPQDNDADASPTSKPDLLHLLNDTKRKLKSFPTTKRSSPEIDGQIRGLIRSCELYADSLPAGKKFRFKDALCGLEKELGGTGNARSREHGYRRLEPIFDSILEFVK